MIKVKVFLNDESKPNMAAEQVLDLLHDTNRTLISVSQFVSYGRLFTTVFYKTS